MGARDAATRVADYCRRHGLLPESSRVLALVSGGPDSVCLMHLLHGAAVDVRVLSIDHGLRAESAAVAASVVDQAGEIGLPGEVRRLRLGLGAGLQERAREARYAVAWEVAEDRGCDLVATGHTATDQAETILFRLARGTGRTGALGMAPHSGRLIRPLLCLTRDETAAYCAEHGLSSVTDPSNADPVFTRTRVREGLLASLREVHPDAERHVAAFADLLRDEGALIEGIVRAAHDRLVGPGGIDARGLAAEPAAVARLVLREAIAAAGGGGDAMASAAVDRALAVARGEAVAAELPGGILVHRSRQVLRIEAHGARET